MNWYNKVTGWLGTRAVRGGLLVVVLLLGAYFAVSTRNSETIAEEAEQPPMVTVTTAQSYTGASTINLIGTVRAFSEASVTSEVSGRVTSVRVGLGDTVAAGAIIATIENAAE